MAEHEALLWGLWILGGFLLGSVMFCELLPKRLAQKDVIQLSPDRNPGAANVFLTCGAPMGLLCLALDMGKGFLPVYFACQTMDIRQLPFAAVLAAPVLGHALAPLNHFHGGKCIATAFGEMIALLPATRIGLCLAGLYIFFSVVVRIKPNRVRSIVTFTIFGLAAVAWGVMVQWYALAAGCGAIALIAVLRHTRRFSTVPAEEKA